MKNGLLILGQLNDLDVEWLLENGSKASISVGENIIKEGEAHEKFYIILSGIFSVYTEVDGYKEYAKVEIGEIVGEMSLVQSGPASASVKAIEPAEVFAVSNKLIAEHLEDDKGFSSRFYYALCIMLSDRLRRSNAQLSGKNIEDAEEFADELDFNVMESLHLAGARMDMIIRQLS